MLGTSVIYDEIDLATKMIFSTQKKIIFFLVLENIDLHVFC